MSEHRDFPGRMPLIALLRTIHVVGVVGLGASVLGGQGGTGADGYIAALAGSGFGIALLDAQAHPGYFKQINGAVVLVKLVVFAGLGWSGHLGATAFWGLLVLSVLSSHASGRWRHRRIAR